MFDDTAIASGEFTLELFDPKLEGDERVLKRLVVPNLLVTAGKEAMANRISSTASSSPPKYLAIGSGSTTANEAQTALVTELKRKEATWSVAGKVLTGTVEFAPGEGTGTVKELGSFTASSGGTMYSRAVVEEFAKTAELGLILSWALTVN